MDAENACRICPRECGVDRREKAGCCGIKGSPDTVFAARAMLHFGEEPIISGDRGSGAVFFSGCNMRCVFCQNYGISSGCKGREISVERLSEIFLELQEQGAHNINLVTATHFVPQVIKALELSKDKLIIPVVYNCGGYEKLEALKMLEGLVDIYLPDVKYFDDRLAVRYSGADGYFDTAMAAVKEMIRQTGKYEIKDGVMRRGVIVRHLLLPTLYKDSIKIFEALAEYRNLILISLMRQYYPCGRAEEFPEINRRVTTFEYRRVLDFCRDLGFEGFTQQKQAATGEMTPDFDFSGI